MAELALRNGLVAVINDSDQAHLSRWQWGWTEQMGVIRYDAEQYDAQAQRTQHVLLGRVITRAEEGMCVVHVDGDRLNNQRENLLLLDHAQFSQYTQEPSGRSAYLGVHWKRAIAKWAAEIGAHGEKQWLGTFEDEGDAARAYDQAALEIYGPSARLNFPRPWRVCPGCNRAFEAHALKAAPYHNAICRAKAELRQW